MLRDIRNSRVETPDGQTLFGVRFIFRDGVMVLWREDPDQTHAERLLRVPNAKFVKRHRLSEPHIVLTNNGAPEQSDIYRIYPGTAGGCGCGSPMKGYSYAQLLSEELTSV